MRVPDPAKLLPAFQGESEAAAFQVLRTHFTPAFHLKPRRAQRAAYQKHKTKQKKETHQPKHLCDKKHHPWEICIQERLETSPPPKRTEA